MTTHSAKNDDDDVFLFSLVVRIFLFLCNFFIFSVASKKNINDVRIKNFCQLLNSKNSRLKKFKNPLKFKKYNLLKIEAEFSIFIQLKLIFMI